MKTEGAIRNKIKQIRFRYLKQVMAESLERKPENCKHNDLCHSLSDNKTFRVCGLPPSGQTQLICDARYNGGNRAPNCTSFTPLKSKEDIKAEFTENLNNMSFPEIAYNYPDMAALLWVLSDDTSSVVVVEPEPNIAPVPPPNEPPPPPAELVPVAQDRPKSWMQRLLERII